VKIKRKEKIKFKNQKIKSTFNDLDKLISRKILEE